MSDPLRLGAILNTLFPKHRPTIWPEPMGCNCGCETIQDIEEETP